MDTANVDAQASTKLEVVLRMLSGEDVCLPALEQTDTVRDLARAVRANTGIPMSVQNLVWDAEVLSEPSVRLCDVFGGVSRVESLTVLRRPFTVSERKELFKRLVVATAASRVGEVRELLREGAPVNLDANCQGEDLSLCLDHWGDVVDEPEASKDVGERNTKKPKTNSGQNSDDSDGDFNADEEGPDGDDDDDANDDEDDDQTGVVQDAADTDEACLPCGGITPMMMAIATGNDNLTKDLEACGAQRPDMTTKHATIQDAFRHADFADIVKHFSAGVDINCQLRRGEGVRDTSQGTPLHACAALFRLPGSYETAQLLIAKGADLDAPDEEGDSPLAHARYFGAHELYRLYSGHGASLTGPFYARFGAH
eukprot:TRINITY_DN4709_c0_g1_i1.p1 TRINITY_DN4709_c0_g1~~TRINITY_DN4709_c0_g1_i1.p1  ORF type:complete len:369 (-),score=74.36 TRINITY_DN4709_c0_g1_i1:139-1245(-)